MLNLAKQIGKMRHNVVVLDRKYSPNDPDIDYVDDVKILRLRSRNFTNFNFTTNFVLTQVAFALQVKRYIKRTSNIDVIHVYCSVITLLRAILKPSIRCKPVVIGGIVDQTLAY